MGRGVSAGGGQSSLGYLFGSGETTKNAQVAQNQGPAANNEPSQKPAAAPAAAPAATPAATPAAAPASQPIDKEIPAGVPGHLTNNYFRAEGQNCGNFITV